MISAGRSEQWAARAHADQAIANYVESEAHAVLAEEFEVRTAVVINKENTLTVANRAERRGAADPE